MTIFTSITHQSEWDTLVAAGASEFVALTLDAAIGFVASIGAINNSIATPSTVNALAGSATEFTRAALAVGFIGTIRAIRARVAFSGGIDASAVPAPKLIRRASGRTVDFIRSVCRTVHFAIAAKTAVNASTEIALPLQLTARASGLVTSVPAVAPAVAALGDGDTRVVLAAEFAGLTWFHAISFVFSIRAILVLVAALAIVDAFLVVACEFVEAASEEAVLLIRSVLTIGDSVADL